MKKLLVLLLIFSTTIHAQTSTIQSNKVIGWLTENAHPISSVTDNDNFEDMEWLQPVLKGARYVGMGEATHGTKEFFEMKHRMLAFLVKKMGYTVFAMEASYAGCKNINDYVLYGEGDVHTALATQGFWTWDTEEVADMIEWMRSYNISQPAEKLIQFVGFDIQNSTTGGGVAKLKDYLLRVDPEFEKKNDTLFGLVALAEKNNGASPNDSLLGVGFRDLIAHVTSNKLNYIGRSSREAYADVLQYATIISQYLDVYMMQDSDPRGEQRDWRDYYMAQNLKTFISKNPDKKIIIWAHNAHISKNSEPAQGRINKPLGSYLETAYGDKYYAMGFSFSKGSFQARGMDSNGIKPLVAYTVPDAKVCSFEWYLKQTKLDKFIINFRRKDIPFYVTDFINLPLMSRNYGSVINNDTYVNDYFTPITVSKDFDAIIFIDNITRATPTKTGVRN